MSNMMKYFGKDSQGNTFVFDIDTCDGCGRNLLSHNAIKTGNSDTFLLLRGFERYPSKSIPNMGVLVGLELFCEECSEN
jgi:hypothetical protein